MIFFLFDMIFISKTLALRLMDREFWRRQERIHLSVQSSSFLLLLLAYVDTEMYNLCFSSYFPDGF